MKHIKNMVVSKITSKDKKHSKKSLQKKGTTPARFKLNSFLQTKKF
jgi:hypothetical protein